MRRLAVLVLGCVVAAPACGGKSPAAPKVPPLPVAEESAHYTFHYAPGDSVEAARQEAYHVWATGRLGVQLPRKIDYYKYRTRQEMGDHTGKYDTNGFGEPGTLTIHTLGSWDNHEVVHVYMSTLGQSCSLFSEGIAVAFETDPANGDFVPRFQMEDVHVSARRYLATGQLVLPLDRLIETKSFWEFSDTTLTYREAGSFVRFLLDQYGLDRFLAFYRSGVQVFDSRATIKSHFSSTMGVSFETAEGAWLEMLRRGT